MEIMDRKKPLLNNYCSAPWQGTTVSSVLFLWNGRKQIRKQASSWILHMAFIILTANAWGLVLKEWKGLNRKTILT
jgi:L-rhamnose-H+ transport protein